MLGVSVAGRPAVCRLPPGFLLESRADGRRPAKAPATALGRFPRGFRGTPGCTRGLGVWHKSIAMTDDTLLVFGPGNTAAEPLWSAVACVPRHSHLATAGDRFVPPGPAPAGWRAVMPARVRAAAGRRHSRERLAALGIQSCEDHRSRRRLTGPGLPGTSMGIVRVAHGTRLRSRGEGKPQDFCQTPVPHARGDGPDGAAEPRRAVWTAPSQRLHSRARVHGRHRHGRGLGTVAPAACASPPGLLSYSSVRE